MNKGRLSKAVRGLRIFLFGMVAAMLPVVSAHAAAASPAPAERMAPPRSVPDPIEPLNRAIWEFNKVLMTDVVRPTARVYRTAIPRPLRQGISNMGRNLNYPDRLVNNLLQGQWAGVRDETYRFLCNSTIGLGGIIDVAGGSGVPKWDADFGQTFGKWGWKPTFYLMLPIYGPSNDRDLVGFGGDMASNPLLYISPYDLNWQNPLTYLGPYSYFTYGVTYNNLSDSVDRAVRFTKSEVDPYATLEYAWTFERSMEKSDLSLHGAQDAGSLDSLGSVLVTYRDPEFYSRSTTRQVLIPGTGRKLPYTYWLRPGKAPLVFLVPGLGSHRLTDLAMALAELLYRNGCSVVCISSPYHAEFMNAASTAALPAYLPSDAYDVHAAFSQINRALEANYPGRFGEKALLGYSMGALETLYLAANHETNDSTMVQFDRFVAINPPVRLLHGMTMLDDFYSAPLRWPEAERNTDMKNALLKAAALEDQKLPATGVPPFNAIESEFLVGLAFRFTLRDIIYTSQKRENLGVLRHSLGTFRRQGTYEEIMQFSYQDYLKDFAAPYYKGRGMGPATEDLLADAGDLRVYEAGLRANSHIHVFINDNDFLLSDEDKTWLHSVFDGDRLTAFPRGGHLGNLANTNVQSALVGAFSGLR